jgi:Phosphotransferase enzyme family
MVELPAGLADAAATLHLRITRTIRRTDKTLLAAGTLAGQRVAVKCLLDTDPFWAAKLRHEARVYELFAVSPPPVRVPRLLYTDHSRLLVLEWLDGRSLDDERYPQRGVTAVESEAAIECALAFSRWVVPAGAFGAGLDYPERFGRYHARGYLGDVDLTALNRLLSRTGPPRQVGHGDPLPSNILLGPGNHVALLDWEFAGLFLPGFDLAMLYVLLGARTPSVRERVDELVAGLGAEDAFAVNLTAVVIRELRLHRELPGGPLRDSRLPLIEGAWRRARQRLHRRASDS